MMRIQNWDVELNRWAASRISNPFEWGKTDCVILAWEALKAMYSDGIKINLPSWSSKEDAYRILKGCGGIKAELLNMKAVEVPIKMCQAGDILIFNSGTNIEGCGVCLGRMYLSVRFNESVRTRLVDYDDDAVICMRL